MSPDDFEILITKTHKKIFIDQTNRGTFINYNYQDGV